MYIHCVIKIVCKATTDLNTFELQEIQPLTIHLIASFSVNYNAAQLKQENDSSVFP